MNRNSNLSPLPFYETIEEQSFRKSYAYGIVFPLLAPKNRFLPFQIVSPVLQLPSLAEPEGTASSLKVTLCNFDGSVTMDITTAMVEAGLVVKSFDEDGYRVISFPGIVDKDIWKEFGLDFNNDFSMADFGGQYTSGEGRGYLVVEYEGNTWYSDVMTLVGDLSGCLKIEWYSYTDIVYKGGRIAYEGIPYANIMYVRQEIGKPTYDFSDEGEDRNGEYFATKQISEKTYHSPSSPPSLCVMPSVSHRSPTWSSSPTSTADSTSATHSSRLLHGRAWDTLQPWTASSSATPWWYRHPRLSSRL